MSTSNGGNFQRGARAKAAAPRRADPNARALAVALARARRPEARGRQALERAAALGRGAREPGRAVGVGRARNVAEILARIERPPRRRGRASGRPLLFNEIEVHINPGREAHLAARRIAVRRHARELGSIAVSREDRPSGVAPARHAGGHDGLKGGLAVRARRGRGARGGGSFEAKDPVTISYRYSAQRIRVSWRLLTSSQS